MTQDPQIAALMLKWASNGEATERQKKELCDYIMRLPARREPTRVDREWGDAHMEDFEKLTEKQQLQIMFLVEGNSQEDLAIMLIQHFTDDELEQLEKDADKFEVDNEEESFGEEPDALGDTF